MHNFYFTMISPFHKQKFPKISIPALYFLNGLHDYSFSKFVVYIFKFTHFNSILTLDFIHIRDIQNYKIILRVATIKSTVLKQVGVNQ